MSIYRRLVRCALLATVMGQTMFMSAAADYDKRLAFSTNRGIEILAGSEAWCAPFVQLGIRLMPGSRYIKSPEELPEYLQRFSSSFVQKSCSGAVKVSFEMSGTFYEADKADAWTVRLKTAVAPAAAAAAKADIFPNYPNVSQGGLLYADLKAQGLNPSPNQLGPLLAYDQELCRAYLEAEGNEIAMQRYSQQYLPELRSRLARAGDTFVFRGEVRLGSYRIDERAFEFTPFDTNRYVDVSRSIENYRCRSVFSESDFPRRYSITFDQANLITRLEVAPSLGERIISEADRKVTVEYYIQTRGDGFTGGETRTAMVSPVALRVYVEVDGTRHELKSLKPKAMAALVTEVQARQAAERMAAAAEERLLAEQRAREDALREAEYRVREMNNDAANLYSRLQRADPVKRMLVLADMEEGRFQTDHLKARWEAYIGGASVRVALIVRADESGRDDVEMAWPRHMKVERGANEDMRSGHWYLVTGELELERRRDGDSGSPQTALLELDSIIECAKAECAEGNDIEAAVMERYPETTIFPDKD